MTTVSGYDFAVVTENERREVGEGTLRSLHIDTMAHKHKIYDYNNIVWHKTVSLLAIVIITDTLKKNSPKKKLSGITSPQKYDIEVW